ncbi:MAG: T9SS type A sorting domain-containing protein [Janthinobacterium lividum]
MSTDPIKGAIGLYARQSYTDPVTNQLRDRVSEYAQAHLSSPLYAGVRYYIDFQVSLSHRTAVSTACNYGVTSGFGLLFTNNVNSLSTIGTTSTSLPTTSSRDFIAYPSGANFNTVFNTVPLTDNAVNFGTPGTANWQRVSKQITGNGEQYVTAGLFDSNRNNQVLLANGDSRFRNTYFLLDAVRIFRIPTAGNGATKQCTPSGNEIVLGEGCDMKDVGATYAWTETGGSTVLGNSLHLTVNPAVTTSYTLTVTLPDGSLWATSATVTVPYPTAGHDQTICPGESAIIGQGCSIPGAAYLWSSPNTGTFASGNLQVTVSPTVTTTYTLTIYPPNNHSYVTQTTVYVLYADTPDFSLSATYITFEDVPENSTICRGTQLRIIATVNNPQQGVSYSYNWSVPNAQPSDYNAGVDPRNPSVLYITFYSPTGMPRYALTRQFLIDCTVTASACNRSVSNSGEFGLYSTAGEDGHPCDIDDGGGSRRGNDKQVSLAYPNPATGTLTLPEGTYNAVLLDSQGKPVRESNSGYLDVRTLPAGLYNLRTVQDGKVVNQHIEVQH